jgi:hypothetical protein
MAIKFLILRNAHARKSEKRWSLIARLSMLFFKARNEATEKAYAYIMLWFAVKQLSLAYSYIYFRLRSSV